MSRSEKRTAPAFGFSRCRTVRSGEESPLSAPMEASKVAIRNGRFTSSPANGADPKRQVSSGAFASLDTPESKAIEELSGWMSS